MQSTRHFSSANMKAQLLLLHIWRICICCTLPYPFIKAWISVQASVNIHFLESIWFLHSVGRVPWIRTSAPSFLFLHSSLPFSCFQAQIQLDCGEDNICVPDLKLAVYGWEDVVCLCLYLVCLHTEVLEVYFYWRFHMLVVWCGVSEVFLMVLIEATHCFIWLFIVVLQLMLHINDSQYDLAFLLTWWTWCVWHLSQ